MCYSRTETQAGEVCEKGIMSSRYCMGALYPKRRTIFLAKEDLCSAILYLSFHFKLCLGIIQGWVVGSNEILIKIIQNCKNNLH